MGVTAEKVETTEEEQFTPEEKVILGEADAPEVETATEPESGDQVDGEGDAAAESETEGQQIDPDMEPEPGKPVPYDRFSKVYGEKKTLAEKFDLFKRDPEAYYTLYPNERPAAAPAPAQQAPAAAPMTGDLASITVDGGPFHGKTLAEVESISSAEADRMLNELYAENAALATKLQWQLLDSRKEAANREASESNRYLEESSREIDQFSKSISTKLFGKAEGLDAQQAEQVKTEIGKTINWMKETGRGGGNLADGYWLMNREAELKDAASQGAEAVAKKITAANDSVHISGGPGGGGKSGFEGYIAMSREQLGTAIDRMSEEKYREFVKNAPADLKAKHPDIPW